MGRNRQWYFDLFKPAPSSFKSGQYGGQSSMSFQDGISAPQRVASAIFFQVGSRAPMGVASALSPRPDERIWDKGFLRYSLKSHDGSGIPIFGLIFVTVCY